MGRRKSKKKQGEAADPAVAEVKRKKRPAGGGKKKKAPGAEAGPPPAAEEKAPKKDPAKAGPPSSSQEKTPARRPAGAAAGPLSLPRWLFELGWVGGVVLVLAVYLVFKMYAMHAVNGDENIYLYQGKLVSEGVTPYSGFAMAHPPLQSLFTGLLFAIVGYDFLLGRLLPPLFCLAGAAALAFMVRRELGIIASVIATAMYVLSYEPMRASAHYTGVNITVALSICSVLAYRLGYIRTTAAVCVAAVFTRLYAIPGVIILVLYALFMDRKQALRLIGWGAALGAGAFLVAGLWTGFGDLVQNTLFYHAQKTPMSADEVARMRNTVFFHNVDIALLFLLAQPACIAAVLRRFDATDRKLPASVRLRTAIEQSGTGLVILSSAIALFFMIILLRLDRVWMYYFIPSFPFAAVAAGWLLSGWIRGGVRLARAALKDEEAALPAGALPGSLVLIGLFVLGMLLGPLAETSLGYYQNAMNQPPEKRIQRYRWEPAGLLPEAVDDLVRELFWYDERTIGSWYNRFTYLLWHECRYLDIAEDAAAIIERETSPEGEVFGDSTTLPLFALLSNRRIAGNEVDTNIQRYRSGARDPRQMISLIDKPSTEMIVLRPRYGVAGVGEVKHLVKTKYRMVDKKRASYGAMYQFYKRKPEPVTSLPDEPLLRSGTFR